MQNSFVSDFDSRVKSFFLSSGIHIDKSVNIGIAVSGGADSISLVTSLYHLYKDVCTLKVVTVDHNIRPVEESSGDASYVEEYCSLLNIDCERYNIERGKIVELSKDRDLGIEEAARYERYKAFEDFIKKENIDYLALAHNKNDQIETIVMRFLSGSSTGGLSGIPKIRKPYIRPLYYIDRKDIEKYLKIQNIQYRTDKTNFDTAMYRNTVRNIILPVFNENIKGYEKSLLTLASKAQEDETFIAQEASRKEKELDIGFIEREENNILFFNADKFFILNNAIKRRILYSLINRIGSTGRVPYSLIDNIIKYDVNKTYWKEAAVGILVERKRDKVFICRKVKLATEEVFFVIIKGDGLYTYGNVGVISAKKSGEELFLSVGDRSVCIKRLEYPFILRSMQSGDEILDAAGLKKSISKIAGEWHVGDDRNKLIVVQRLSPAEQNIKALLGSFCGYPDWIVK